MHVPRRVVTAITVTALTLSLGSGIATAQEQPASPPAVANNAAQYSEKVDIDEETLSKLNEARKSDGLDPLPDNTAELELGADGTVAAKDSSGDAIEVEDQPTDFATPQESGGDESERLVQAQGGDSVMKNAAQAVAGCVGGVIGFDAILEILERRVSYWTFVKWLGGKVGWGLAVSCVSGGVSAAMGW